MWEKDLSQKSIEDGVAPVVRKLATVPFPYVNFGSMTLLPPLLSDHSPSIASQGPWRTASGPPRRRRCLCPVFDSSTRTYRVLASGLLMMGRLRLVWPCYNV
jgi:hypothetical protein